MDIESLARLCIPLLREPGSQGARESTYERNIRRDALWTRYCAHWLAVGILSA